MRSSKKNVPQTEIQEKLASIIARELAQAEGADSDEVTRNREAALAAYNNAPLPGDAEALVDGWSTAQSTDVRDMLQAVLGQVMPMLSTDAVVQFEPQGADDEDAARAESAAVEYIIMSRNQGFIEFEEAIHDGLLLRNAWTKVDCEVTETVNRVPLDGTETAETLAFLLNPRKPAEARERVEDKIVITTIEKRFCFNAVPVENVFFMQMQRSATLRSCAFTPSCCPIQLAPIW